MRKRNTWQMVVKDLTAVKPYFYWISGLFLVSVIIGLFAGNHISIAMLKEIVQQISAKKGLAVPLAIILNNLKAASLGILLGVFFGFFPLLVTAINGLVIGSVLANVISNNPLSLWKILPHGIFELPAIILAFAIGMKLGLEPKKFKDNTMVALRLFFIIVLPLIFLAGLIEGALFLLMS